MVGMHLDLVMGQLVLGRCGGEYCAAGAAMTMMEHKVTSATGAEGL